MKNLGFTLAEVLITLGIIGVVSAITLPTLMSNSVYKQVGVKLSKFQSTTEIAALAHVASQGIFENINDVSDFINQSFIFKQIYDKDGNKSDVSELTFAAETQGKYAAFVDKMGGERQYAILKDGTAMAVFFGIDDENGNELYALWPADETLFPPVKYGTGVVNIVFDPMVKVPSTGIDHYLFVLTSKGYVIPVNKGEQPCTTELFNNDWRATASMYKSDGVCSHTKNSFDGK